MTTLVIEAADEIFDSPRTLLAERFCEWLVEARMIEGLPAGEIVITITPDAHLTEPYADEEDRALGCFAVALGPFLNRRWEVVLAYGDDYKDAADIDAWLTTIPHELLHLAEFAAAHSGRTPHEAGLEAIRASGQDGPDGEAEERIENLADRVSTRFALAHPELTADASLLRSAFAPAASLSGRTL